LEELRTRKIALIFRFLYFKLLQKHFYEQNV
jgi:hypothetical protein